MIPPPVAALLKAYGVDSMKLEWNVKGQQTGQPITLTLRWTPEKKVKKSPSTRRHETERTLKYFNAKREERKNSMDRVYSYLQKEESGTEMTDSDSDENNYKQAKVKEEEQSIDEGPEQMIVKERTYTEKKIQRQ